MNKMQDVFKKLTKRRSIFAVVDVPYYILKLFGMVVVHPVVAVATGVAARAI
jgi:hypothetical protein